jgi:hypothetical protein
MVAADARTAKVFAFSSGNAHDALCGQQLLLGLERMRGSRNALRVRGFGVELTGRSHAIHVKIESIAARCRRAILSVAIVVRHKRTFEIATKLA